MLKLCCAVQQQGEGVNKSEFEVMKGTQENGGEQKDPFGDMNDFEFIIPERQGPVYPYPPAPFFTCPPPFNKKCPTTNF